MQPRQIGITLAVAVAAFAVAFFVAGAGGGSDKGGTAKASSAEGTKPVELASVSVTSGVAASAALPALKSAKTPQQQAAAAKALAKSFHGAGRTLARQDLSPADRGVNGLLVKALRQTGGGYDKAASAAAKKSKSAFSKAGGDVAEGRKAIASALDGLKAAGYDVAS